MEEIKKFLSEPEEHQDEFWESDALIWVDWRDFDESIIEYFNKKLPDEDKIQFECVETEKERGVEKLFHSPKPSDSGVFLIRIPDIP